MHSRPRSSAPTHRAAVVAGAPRARLPAAVRRSLALLFLVSYLSAQIASGPPLAAAQSGALAGPPLETDVGALSGGGFEAVGQTGGLLWEVARETGRPVAWTGIGPRVVALGLGAEGVRTLGRSPALPAIVLNVAADGGRVLVIDDTAARAVWLVDGRDPAWPRAVRPLRLGARAYAVAVHGTRGLVLAGREMILLDLSAFDAPRVVARVPVAPLEVLGPREPVIFVAAALSEGVAAIVVRKQLLVYDLRGAGPPALVLDQREPEAADVLIDGRRLFVREHSNRIRLHELDDLAQVAGYRHLVLPAATFYDMDVRGARLVLAMQRPDGEAVGVQAFDLDSDGDAAPVGRFQALAFRSGPKVSPEPLAVLAGADQIHLLTEGRRIETFPEAGLTAEQTVLAARWRPAVGVLDDAAASGMHMVVASLIGDVTLVAGEAPTGLRTVGRWPAEPDAPRPGVFAMDWVADRLWLLTTDGLRVLDASRTTHPRVAYAGPMQPSLAITHDERYVYAFDGDHFVIFDARVVGEPKPIVVGMLPFADVFALAMHRMGDHVWVTSSSPTGGRLLAIDVSDPMRPKLVAELLASEVIYALAATDGYLVALSGSARIQAEALSVIDIRNPSDPREVGRLDLGDPLTPTTLYPINGDVIVVGHEAVVAHEGFGIVRVDLRIPERPDELGRSALPGRPIRLAWQGDRLWVAGRQGGITLLRLADGAPDLVRRLWLPLALGSGE